MAEHGSILKNNQNTCNPRFSFTPKTGTVVPKTGVPIYCVGYDRFGSGRIGADRVGPDWIGRDRVRSGWESGRAAGCIFYELLRPGHWPRNLTRSWQRGYRTDSGRRTNKRRRIAMLKQTRWAHLYQL